MPIFSYFLVVGSILTGLLFSVDTVIAPSSLPFKVSQRMETPKPYKARLWLDFSESLSYLIATTVERSIAVADPVTDVQALGLSPNPQPIDHTCKK